MDTEVVTEEMM